MSCVALTTQRYIKFCPNHRAISIDIALWSGLYVMYNPVVSFDLRCQSGKKINSSITLQFDVSITATSVCVQMCCG